MGRPKRTIPVDPLIGERIRIARKSIKLSQENFADKIGVSATSIRNWEKGRFEPDNGNLHIIAKECNVSVAWLKGEDVQTIIEKSKNILDNFNPEKYVNIAPNLAAETHAWAEEWYPIMIEILEHLGYSVMEIRNTCDFYKLSMFMEAEIKHSIETYINNFIEKEKQNYEQQTKN